MVWILITVTLLFGEPEVVAVGFETEAECRVAEAAAIKANGNGEASSWCLKAEIVR